MSAEGWSPRDQCQHYPCDPDCCPGLWCEQLATVTIDGVGRFCEAHAREYVNNEESEQ